MLNKIKTIIDTRFMPRKKNGNSASGPCNLPAAKYGITAKKISNGAKTVVSALTDAGYEAYVVGGCVRDILLDLHPKDFDVATNATPEQVKAIFNRSRIVGRRFQIVHVRMGREVIEVTTFRAHHQQTETGRVDQRETSRRSDKGLLLRDNIFGTIDQDACRRDFTMNALYYHPQDNKLYDYANGVTDIENRTIRIIGDASLRYREDPVRMLRAVRFAAKLGFDIEPETAKPIQKLGKLLAEIPPARLFDESLKLFMNGQALATFGLLRNTIYSANFFPKPTTF
ncbi:MAG: polynucleotide adenylyltransferase PcnB [Porticoccaceae bacterium]